MLDRLLSALSRLLGFAPGTRDEARRYRMKVFDDRRAAAIAARRPGVAALVRVEDNDKWCLFACPCGCDQQIALNLMKSHSPRWRVDAESDTTLSIYPSVESRTCGAHFLVRRGKVIWCEPSA